MWFQIYFFINVCDLYINGPEIKPGVKAALLGTSMSAIILDDWIAFVVVEFAWIISIYLFSMPQKEEETIDNEQSENEESHAPEFALEYMKNAIEKDFQQIAKTFFLLFIN